MTAEASERMLHGHARQGDASRDLALVIEQMLNELPNGDGAMRMLQAGRRALLLFLLFFFHTLASGVVAVQPM